MKPSVLMILYVFILSACTGNNHIQTSKENGLNRMSLVQTPEVNVLKATNGLTSLSGLKASANYLYADKAEAKPQVTLDLKVLKGRDELSDSLVYITLDGENIQLSSLRGQLIIAENLWVPIVHAQTIQYKLDSNHDVVVVSLNEKQKSQLIAFFHQAIKQRDVLFPAVPPGKKKW